jgi:hypothetical protein
MRSSRDRESEATVEGEAPHLRDLRETQRLRAAESDLRRAIAACTAALAEVRRELRGTQPRTPRVIH